MEMICIAYSVNNYEPILMKFSQNMFSSALISSNKL